MIRRPSMVSALAAVLLFLHIGFALAADPTPLPEKTQTQKQEQQEQQKRIYGHKLMTSQERTEYRANMQTAKTGEEREQIRKEHENAMILRYVACCCLPSHLLEVAD